MLDDRLSKDENAALSVEDINDVYEIFDSIDDCIDFIDTNTDYGLEKIRKDFNLAINEYCFKNNIDYYTIVYDKFVIFKSGRVAYVEFY
ncbi:TPA: hypothetical protein ACF2DE_002912 [Clostridium perfringens]